MSARAHSHYWKCDRPAAFHGIAASADAARIEPDLRQALQRAFPNAGIDLSPGAGQGNHLTWRARIGEQEGFVRVEDGPERDDYLEVESHLLDAVRGLGLPTPRVLAVDATRAREPFAWQVLEHIAHPDLNHPFKQGRLDLYALAPELGAAVARWQALRPAGFGPFSTDRLRRSGALQGLHAGYADHFLLHLDRHLDFLERGALIGSAQAQDIRREIAGHAALLQLDRGCLVHKDLALWNILGSESRIAAFIDWDDAISGDPMDDLSLLGCFHGGPVVAAALAGYATVRPLPSEHRRRFWLHLLRNMIVKAVIRLGAGYFERSDSFFLIGAGATGGSLRDFTLARLDRALNGLRTEADPSTL